MRYDVVIFKITGGGRLFSLVMKYGVMLCSWHCQSSTSARWVQFGVTDVKHTCVHSWCLSTAAVNSSAVSVRALLKVSCLSSACNSMALCPLWDGK